jgi:hypothetical protein
MQNRTYWPEIQDGRRRHLVFTFLAAVSYFLSDFHQILQEDACYGAACGKIKTPEVKPKNKMAAAAILDLHKWP